jgi:hypothetical protein
MESSRISAQSDAGDAPIEMVWLLGQPHLADYLDFVKHKVVGGAELPPRQLADEWRAANDLYYDLEQSEAGIADAAEILPLPRALKRLARKVEADPHYREAFGTLPTEIAMVELDRLILSQNHVERRFTDALAAGLGTDPAPEALFNFCLPLGRPQPPVQARRIAADRYLFTSPSTDFRVHPAALAGPDEVGRLHSFGPVTAAITLMVGFGSNFLSAVRSGDRLLLQNGYHRAYALRALGITHAPCAVTTVTRKDELRIAACDAVCADPEFYFAAKRPPLLKDYFDPRFAKLLQVVPMETVIEVEFKLRTSTAVIR